MLQLSFIKKKKIGIFHPVHLPNVQVYERMCIPLLKVCVCVKVPVLHGQSLCEDEKLLINFSHSKIYLIKKNPFIKKKNFSVVCPENNYLSMSMSFYALAGPNFVEMIFKVKTALKPCKSNP